MNRTYWVESRSVDGPWRPKRPRKTLNGSLGDLRFYISRTYPGMPTEFRVVDSDGRILATRSLSR